MDGLGAPGGPPTSPCLKLPDTSTHMHIDGFLPVPGINKEARTVTSVLMTSHGSDRHSLLSTVGRAPRMGASLSQ